MAERQPPPDWSQPFPPDLPAEYFGWKTPPMWSTGYPSDEQLTQLKLQLPQNETECIGWIGFNPICKQIGGNDSFRTIRNNLKIIEGKYSNLVLVATQIDQELETVREERDTLAQTQRATGEDLHAQIADLRAREKVLQDLLAGRVSQAKGLEITLQEQLLNAAQAEQAARANVQTLIKTAAQQAEAERVERQATKSKRKDGPTQRGRAGRPISVAEQEEVEKEGQAFVNPRGRNASPQRQEKR